MKQIIALLLLLVVSNLAVAGTCPVTEKNLIGSWSLEKNNVGFFEEFLLEIDSGEHVFNSWLHERPGLVDARWVLKNCQLSVIPQYDEFSPVHLKVLSFKHDRLRVSDIDDPDHVESTYVRDPNGT